ncbi:MAG TPA: alkaline phosphatase family protein [Thermoplasmata archaeon]|nr:alkaline phosphatase family protein [Thermoplasmata archaeon]
MLLGLVVLATTWMAAVGGAGATPTAGNIGTTQLPTKIRHVIVVMEENHDLSWTLSDPVFKALYVANAHATHAYAICHPSAPNYIAVSSATKHQCGSDAVSYYSDTNLASDLAGHGLTWQGLFDSMPSACDRSDSYPYIAHHNPWVYYSNLRSSCAKHDLAFFASGGTSRLQSELAGGTLPSFTFISPNMLHDAHDGSLSAASAWLTKNVLVPVKTSLKYSGNTAVIVTFDEAYAKNCKCAEAGGYTSGGARVSGGPIYLVVSSPVSPATNVVTKKVSLYNVATTVEWLLGVPSLGHNDNKNFPALTGLFN